MHHTHTGLNIGCVANAAIHCQFSFFWDYFQLYGPEYTLSTGNGETERSISCLFTFQGCETGEFKVK